MSRVNVFLAAWLILLIGGWGLDVMLAQRVLGSGAIVLSLIPVLLSRSQLMLFTAAALTPIALLSVGLARPVLWHDIEEVQARILGIALAWGSVLVGVLQERWRRVAAHGDVRLAALADALPDIIWVGTPGVVPNTPRTVSGAPSDAPGPAWSAFTGQRRDQSREEGWLQAVHPDDRSRARALWLTPDPQAWPDDYDIEVRLWHAPDHAYRVVAMSVRPLPAVGRHPRGWVGVIIDRHERDRSAILLAVHREQLAQAYRLAHAGHWELAIATGMVSISADLAAAFGSPDGASERPLAEVLQMFAADARDIVAAELQQLIDSGEEHRGEYGVVLEDGVRRVGALTARREVRADGTVVIAGTLQDVTQRVRAVQREGELELQLLQSARMQTVGELATGLAHDFNNVLATMIGFGELARKRLAGVDAQSQVYLDRVVEAGARAGDLVRTLMSFARGKGAAPGTQTAVALGPIVTQTLRLVRATVPGGIEIHADISGDVHVRVEPIHLQDALLNLCINARDALGTSGKLSVALSLRETHDTCAVCGARLRGPAAVLSVRDNGAGVDPGALPYIFEPFYSTKPEHQGTGMGLAMVAQLTHRNGGHVLVSSTRGDTRFSLVFPGATAQRGDARSTADARADAVTAADYPDPVSSVADHARGMAGHARGSAGSGDGAARGARQRVMVVDDEPSIGRLVASALESYGVAVTVFVEPREALAAYRAQPGHWDLLITDLTMPGMSGLELAGLVRQSHEIPVLLLTGGGASDEELRSAGVIDQIMRKPFVINEFVRAAAALLRDRARPRAAAQPSG